MRIPSGVTDQVIYFVAVDSTDLKTRETGLTTFTVYRDRNGAGAAAMTTPTVTEVDATNMPGLYKLLLDEDMTIGSGNDSEEMVFHISQASMADVDRTIEIYRPKITVGNTLDVTATGAAGIDWANIENTATAVALSGTDIQLVGTATNVTNQVTANMTAISGDSGAADNMEATYDGTGYADPSAPATQSQLDGVANVGSAVHKAASSYVLTTGTQSANTVTSTEALDGTRHEHTDDAGAMDLYYEFSIGSGVPTSVQVTGYVTGNNDDIDVMGYDWVSASYKQIGNLQGTNSAVNSVNSYDMFIDMVGSGANEGTIRVQFVKASGLTSALLAIDQVFIAFTQGIEGYDNGSVWADGDFSNTGTVVGIDGVARNPVSTIAAVNTLLAATNLHTVTNAPGTSFTFPGAQTNEMWLGRHWTLAFGGVDITGSVIEGAEVSGISTATGDYRLTVCDIGAVTMDNDGHFERCGLTGTFTVGQAGTFTFHQCFSEALSAVTIDFAAVGATTINMYDFHGDIAPTNMAAGDVLHVTGNGVITTVTCTGGTIDHDGFFDYTDSGGNVTDAVADIENDVRATLADTADMQPKIGAVTDLGGGATLADNNSDIAGATFATSTDSNEAIRNRGDAAWTTGAGGSDRLLLADTTIATLASQTSFTLTAGSADNDAYNNCTIVVEDVSTATQKSIGMVLDYVGSTLTVTLKEALAFTIAATDKVYILAENSLKSTIANRQLDVTATGASGIDWANVENPTTAVDLSGTDIQLVDTTTTNTDMRGTDGANTTVPDAAGTAPTAVENRQEMDSNSTQLAAIVGDTNELQADWVNGGRLDLILDIIAADTTTDIPALIATAQADLDTITGSDGVTLATAQALYAPAIPSEVLTQINAALDTAISELAVAAPTATPTLRTGLMLLYMMARNRVDVDTTGADAMKIYNNAGTQIASKLITDDGTDYSESEMS